MGSNHPFNKRMGRLGSHNLGLKAPKRLAFMSIILKWGKHSHGRKRGRTTTINFDGSYLTIGESDRRSVGVNGKENGEAYWHKKCKHKS